MSVRLLSGVSAKLAEETELEQAASMLQKLQRGRIARKLWDKTLMESRLKQVRTRPLVAASSCLLGVTSWGALVFAQKAANAKKKAQE